MRVDQIDCVSGAADRPLGNSGIAAVLTVDSLYQDGHDETNKMGDERRDEEDDDDFREDAEVIPADRVSMELRLAAQGGSFLDPRGARSVSPGPSESPASTAPGHNSSQRSISSFVDNMEIQLLPMTSMPTSQGREAGLQRGTKQQHRSGANSRAPEQAQHIAGKAAEMRKAEVSL